MIQYSKTQISVQNTQNTHHRVPILKGPDDVFTKVSGPKIENFRSLDLFRSSG